MSISAIQPPKVLWHVVLITFKPNAAPAIKEEVMERFQTLAEDCGGHGAGIMYFDIGPNLDPRKNVALAEIAVFRDNEALQAFRKHPKHIELADLLSLIADWQVGDRQLEITPIRAPAQLRPEFQYLVDPHDPRN